MVNLFLMKQHLVSHFGLIKMFMLIFYRDKNDEIKRVHIYTLPLVSKIANLPNNSEDIYTN